MDVEREEWMAPQQCSDMLGRQAPGQPGGRGRSSPVGALKSDNKEVFVLKTGKKEEELGHQVIQRFPQEKRRNTFEVEEQKGKWRRRERSKKADDDFDNVEMEEMEEEVGKRTVAVDEKQMMDDVVLLMRKVADALAEFAMAQSVDNLQRMGLEE